MLLRIALIILLTLTATHQAFSQTPAPASSSPQRFESEIVAFENEDKKQFPEKNAVLFIGSSSIRLWKTLAQDFPSMRVINRGFGGSQLEDVIYYADRAIIPYQPRTIVLYCGGNDIASGKTPQRVFDDFKKLTAKIREKLPTTRLFYISIMPNPARWHLDDKVKEANELIKKHISGDKRLRYINAYPAFLGAGGTPRPELYVADRLHLNAEGYKVLRSAVAPYIEGTNKK